MRYIMAALLMLLASEATAQTITTTVITMPDGRVLTCTRTCIFENYCTIRCD